MRDGGLRQVDPLTREVIETLIEMVQQHATSEDGLVCSFGLSANERALELLGKLKMIKDGRLVWNEEVFSD